MRIAHVCPFFKPTICGVGQVVYELAKRQVRAGHEVHVFCSDSDKNKRLKRKFIIVDGIFVHRCKYLFKVSDLTYIWPEIFLKILSENFDIIHTHSLNQPHVFLAGLAARLKKIPVIHTTHSPWIAAERNTIAKIMVWPVQNIFSRLALNWAKAIIVLSPWEIPFINNITKNKNIFPIPNGVSSEFFDENSGDEFRKKYGIKGKLVLFLARLNKIKGPHILMNAAKQILLKRTDAIFVFAGGDDGFKSELEKMAAGHPNIRILGRLSREDVINAYAAADIYVLPSKREGMPLTLFEAMAAGCPVIATPVNNVPYAMSEPENGFFVNYGDSDALKHRILQLLSDEKLRKRLGTANRKRASNYNWDDIASDVDVLYMRMSNKAPQK